MLALALTPSPARELLELFPLLLVLALTSTPSPALVMLELLPTLVLALVTVRTRSLYLVLAMALTPL